ncbi:APHP domain-containing protein [Natronorubrum tibetense GA33]|uniref:APHP domain-containing protein n=2 Tax=Natronorubrum tibetense TaxID=63128 RepID=L9VKZ1_9EURY|nr:APHP domain-containing protein [Natronorubrum tibetense GA33]
MSFEEVADTSFDKNGELSSIEYETDEAGQYVAIVSTGDTDSSLLNNNELDPQGDSTIVGVEGFLVHSDSSTVDAPSEIEPGENATFEAETGLEGDDIAHGVVLYDEDEFTNTDTVINATTEPSSEFSMDDIVIERDVVGLNGVFSFQNETDHQRTTGETELEQLRDELHAMLDIGGDVTLTDDVETKAGDTYLTGSMTAIQTDEPKANLTVETYGNWSEHDDYRWIHVAADSDGEFETSTDVMELADEDDDTGGPGIPSPGPPEEPDYRVSDATLSDAKIAPGDSFEVSAKLQNVGEGTGPFIAELLVDGEVVDDQIVRVGPGEKDTITFTHSFNEAGEYEIAINDAVAGTVTVGDKEDETEATFDVTDATLSDTEIEIGDSVDASATVTNTGDETGTFTAELLVDGEVVDEETVQIFAGDETTVEFTKQFDEAGEYEIAINDADAGTLTVIEPGEDDDSAFPIPGFGPLAALLAIAISLFAIRFLPAQN